MSDMGKVFLMTDPPFNQLFTHSLRSGSDCFSKRRDFIQQPSVLGQIGHAKREFTGLAGSNDVTWSSLLEISFSQDEAIARFFEEIQAIA